MSLLDVLRSVPAVIWSGAIGAGLAFGGVLIAGRNQRLMQRSQLQHDAAEKARERTAVLRREVYLKAAEEMVKANVYLGGLAQAELGKGAVGDGLQGFFAAATKLQLVAEMPTALLVSDLADRYGALILRLTTPLMPLMAARSDIALHDKLYGHAQEQVTRVLGEMSRLNESGQPAPEAFGALQMAFESHRALADQHAAARDRAAIELNRLNLSFVRELFLELHKVSELQPKLMVELRRDLALDTDLDRYQKHLDDQWRAKAAQMDEVLRSIEVHLEAFAMAVDGDHRGNGA